jgi:hypothetical protein
MGGQPVNNEVPGPVAAALNAANAGDTERFLDAFAADGAVNDWGRVFTGHAAIRGWSNREFIGVRVSLDVAEVSTAGEVTTVTAQVGGSGFNGPSHFAFTVQDSSIREMRITA